MHCQPDNQLIVKIPSLGSVRESVMETLKREINGRLQDKVMFGSDYPVLMHERLFREFDAEGYKPEVPSSR